MKKKYELNIIFQFQFKKRKTFLSVVYIQSCHLVFLIDNILWKECEE